MRINPLFNLLLALIAPTAISAQLNVSLSSNIEQTLPDLSGAVVYLISDDKALVASHVAKTEIDRAGTEMAQRNLQFAPYIRVVQSGTPVSFPNKDDVAHHVYSFSPNHTFELELYKGRKVPEKRFATPGLVNLGCNIHDWMQGYIYIVDTPWFSQVKKTTGSSENEQSAQILNIPKGHYTLRFWHPGQDRKEVVNQAINIQKDIETVSLALSYLIKAAAQPSPPQEQFDDASDY